MSIQAMSWALGVQLPEPPRAITKAAMRLGLLVLANYADKEGRAWPKLANLEAETCMSARRLQRAFSVLIDAGLLEREGRRRPNGSRTSNVYRLLMQGVTVTPSSGTQQGVTVTGPDPSRPEPSRTGEASPLRPRNSLFDALAACDGGPEGLTSAASRTIGVALAQIKAATPGVTVDEIQRRAGRLIATWGEDKLTASSLAKHWARFGTGWRMARGRDPRPRDIAGEHMAEAFSELKGGEDREGSPSEGAGRVAGGGLDADAGEQARALPR